MTIIVALDPIYHGPHLQRAYFISMLGIVVHHSVVQWLHERLATDQQIVQAPPLHPLE
jgi:hypothetical protein